MFDASNVNFLIAFLAGLVSFLAPCVLAIVPVQAAGLAGSGGSTQTGPFYQKRGFVNGFFFVLGFLLVFMLLGAFANTLGRFLGPWRLSIVKAGGVFLVILGLQVLGLLRIGFLKRTFIFSLDRQLAKWGKPQAFLVGVTLGFAWTPCIGPVLAVILFWSSQLATFWQGFFLLLAYGLGLAIPFLLVSIFIDRFWGFLFKLKRLGYLLNLFLGVLIVLIGVLLISGRFGLLINYTLRLQEAF